MAAALLLAVGGRAEDDNSPPTTAAETTGAAAPDAPYAAIIARNMFNLVPIPPPDPDAGKPPPDPPPKITPSGIVTIFGRPQAIFKVANKPKAGQPQLKDESFVLAEGEMQDEITVVKIEPVEGVITFNNHGTIQELALTPAKEGGAGGGPGGSRGGAGPGAIFGRPNAMGQPSGGGSSPFSGRALDSNPGSSPNSGRNIGNPGSSPVFGGASAANNRSIFSSGTPVDANGKYAPAGNSGLTPEENAILIEAQRAQYLDAGDKGPASILPPTPLTPQVLRAHGSGSAAPLPAAP